MTDSLKQPSPTQEESSMSDFDSRRLEELVANKKTQYGENHPETLNSLRDLELAYRFEGNFSKAEEILQGIVEIQRQDLGETHRDTLTTMTRIAEVRDALGFETEAQSIQNDVLETRRAVLGEHDLDTINSMEQLAIWYQNRGEYFKDKADLEKSVHFWERVVAANKVALGQNNDETIASINSLEEVQSTLGGRNTKS